ncbi:MAG TPA: hypothetical protein VK789_08930 [Bryobacteraceae bacterium]|nr:hypothetical protein [Bryobacteraceae bacterium]
MIQYRRLAALLVGAWLGAGILADVAVTQNFQTVDRFLQKPGSVSTSNALREVPRDRERFILRRNAAEENNWIFLNWERTELAMAAGLFFLLVFGERPQKLMIAMCVTMFLIVAAEHFFLTPLITDIGRRVDDLPATDPESREFWVLHGIYSGLDILKILITAAFAIRLVFKRKPDVNHFVREYEAERADFPTERARTESVNRG